MNRKTERRLIRIMGIWQILDGLLTIIFYGLMPQVGITNSESTFAQLTAISEQFGSVTIFICTFGTFLIGLGISNLVVSKRYVKNDQINIKVGVFLIIQGIFSYAILDIISLALAMTAGVILLAKNKGIRNYKKVNERLHV